MYRIRVGRRIGSAALVADGLHARTDGLTSLAVVVGAVGVAAGWDWADPVVGLAIAAAIVVVLVQAVRGVGERLLDGVDPVLVDQATAAATSVDGVQQVGEVRARWVGHRLQAEARITLGGGVPLGVIGLAAHPGARRSATPRNQPGRAGVARPAPSAEE